MLNPYAATACPPGFIEHRHFPEDAEPVRVSEDHGKWLLRLSAHYELVWASAWGSNANRVLAPMLGLPTLRVVPMPEPPFPPAMKAPAIAAFVQERRAAWLDDMLTAEAYQWAADRDQGATLLIAVDPAIGMTFATVDELERFAGAATG